MLSAEAAKMGWLDSTARTSVTRPSIVSVNSTRAKPSRRFWAAAARGNPTPRMTSAKLKHAYPPWGDEVAADADCALDPGAPKARTDATAKIWRRIILVAKRFDMSGGRKYAQLREDVRSHGGVRPQLHGRDRRVRTTCGPCLCSLTASRWPSAEGPTLETRRSRTGERQVRCLR